MRKTDYGKNGCITLADIERWSVESPIEYQFLEDLFNFAPDFIDKHRQIILAAANRSEAAGSSPYRPPNNSFGNSGQQQRQVLKARHLGGQGQSDAKGQQEDCGEEEEKYQVRDDPVDDQDTTDHVKGKFDAGEKETLVVKRKVAPSK